MTTSPADAPGRPAVAEPRSWRFPAVRTTQTSAGTAVHLIDCPGQYVATVRVVLDLPLTAEPADREGVATILARTLDEGTGRRSADEFAAALERQGAAYGVEVGTDAIHVEVSVPVSHLQPAVELLAEAVTQPAFGASDVRRHVKIRLGEIPQEKAIPAYLVRESFSAELFEPRMRRSRPQGGSSDTVAGITADDVRALYESYVGPAGAQIVFAGDRSGTGIDPAAVIETAFGGWRAEPRGTATAEQPAVRAGGRIVVVNRPGSVQSQLLLGCVGPDRSDSDWAAAAVANHVVGGTITSRVDTVLREERGYTYGTRSAFTATRRGGVFTLGGAVRTEVTAPAVDEALRLVLEATEGLTDDEVAEARSNLIRVAPLRYEQADAVAAQAGNNIACAVPIDFVDSYLAGIEAADAEAATQAYARFVGPERMLTVVVGTADDIVDDLRKLGRGEVTVLS